MSAASSGRCSRTSAMARPAPGFDARRFGIEAPHELFERRQGGRRKGKGTCHDSRRCRALAARSRDQAGGDRRHRGARPARRRAIDPGLVRGTRCGLRSLGHPGEPRPARRPGNARGRPRRPGPRRSAPRVRAAEPSGRPHRGRARSSAAALLYRPPPGLRAARRPPSWSASPPSRGGAHWGGAARTRAPGARARCARCRSRQKDDCR